NISVPREPSDSLEALDLAGDRHHVLAYGVRELNDTFHVGAWTASGEPLFDAHLEGRMPYRPARPALARHMGKARRDVLFSGPKAEILGFGRDGEGWKTASPSSAMTVADLNADGTDELITAERDSVSAWSWKAQP